MKINGSGREQIRRWAARAIIEVSADSRGNFSGLGKIGETACGISCEDRAISLEKARDLDERGFWKDSVESYREALANFDLSEQKLLAGALSWLGRAERRIGQFEASEKSLTQSLKLYEELGLGESAEICFALNECAFLYSTLSQYAAAEAVLERALAIQEKQLPVDHPDLATTLLRKSECLFLTGDASVSLGICERALSMREAAFGPSHPEVAEALEVYGFFLKNAGRLEEAEAALVRSVSIIEAKLGERHASIVNSLVGLTEVLMTREKFAQVESILRRARAICEERIGVCSQPEMMVLNTFAVYYGSLGRLNEALPLLEEALCTGEKLFGPDHSSLANIVNNLAVFYKFLGREKDFEEANERAKALLRLTLVKADGSNPQALISLADKLCLSEQFAEAAEMVERALELTTRQHGARSLKTAEILHAMAALMVAQKKWTAAQDYCDQVVSIYESHLGVDSPQLTAPLRLMAACRLQQGDRADCERIFKRAEAIEQKHDLPDAGLAALKMEFETRKSRLGEDHPAVTEAGRIYGLALQSVGDDDEGMQYLSDYVVRRSAEYAPNASSFMQDIVTNIIMIEVGKNRKPQAFQLLELARKRIQALDMQTNLLSVFLMFEAEFITEDFPSALGSARALALLCRPPEKADVIKLAKQTLVHNAETLSKQGHDQVSEELAAIAESIDCD